MSDRIIKAMKLMEDERINVNPADPPETKWCAMIVRPRKGRKGFHTVLKYGATPVDAIELVWMEWKEGNRP